MVSSLKQPISEEELQSRKDRKLARDRITANARHQKDPERKRQAARERYQRNKDKIKADARALYANDPEYRAKKSASDKAWSANNHDKKIENCSNWYALNAEQQRAAKRQWRAENPEISKERAREQYQLNPDRFKTAAYKRRQKYGSLSAPELQCIRDAGDNVCPYCLSVVDICEIDHCLPLARGGANDADNCAASCKKCNREKHDRTPLEFLLGWPKVTKSYSPKINPGQCSSVLPVGMVPQEKEIVKQWPF